ncbi:MAG: glycine cleavage system aminomethyltransferase GcvT [Gemmataceae bacterium]|nr:glycine cleavage system aminomethyltransferase GcvT [Gemmataceae bacterium]
MTLQTALHPWHASHRARLIDFGGWDMPVLYSSIVDEHNAVRNSFGLFDVSHMGRIEVTGPQALPFLQLICSNNLATLKPGQVRYNLVCREDGNILDDILVYRLNGHYLLVVNASNREKIFSWLLKHLAGFEARVEDKTLATSMIAVQGPKALAIAKELVSPDPSLLNNYFCAMSKVMGKEALVSRTGYTGEDGIEIIVPVGEEVPLWEALAGLGATACGLGARDTLRLEAAMPLYGHEISEEVNPLEAGLAWAVKFDKGNFLGREALWEKNAKAGEIKRVGLVLEGKRIPREGCGVLGEGQGFGRVTSGTFSPTLGKAIAMAYVPATWSQPGTEVDVDIRGKRERAQVAALPFYKRARA